MARLVRRLPDLAWETPVRLIRRWRRTSASFRLRERGLRRAPRFRASSATLSCGRRSGRPLPACLRDDLSHRPKAATRSTVPERQRGPRLSPSSGRRSASFLGSSRGGRNPGLRFEAQGARTPRSPRSTPSCSAILRARDASSPGCRFSRRRDVLDGRHACARSAWSFRDGRSTSRTRSQPRRRRAALLTPICAGLEVTYAVVSDVAATQIEGLVAGKIPARVLSGNRAPAPWPTIAVSRSVSTRSHSLAGDQRLANAAPPPVGRQRSVTRC